MLTSPPQNRYRCRFCGRELPAWLPVAKCPESFMLLYHLGQDHLEAVGLYLRGGRGAWKVDKEVAIMWQPHRCYSLTALALGCVLSTWLWAATAAPAKRPAPATPSAPVPAPTPPEAEHVLALFKAKAEQFQRFLSQDPVILLKQDFSTSPTGVTYYHLRVKLLESGFDVQRSDSLVSPFIGYLYLTYDTEGTEAYNTPRAYDASRW